MSDGLFSPYKIGSMELDNRFVRAATWEGMAGPDGEVTTSLTDVYKRLSKGGVGLILTGYSYINHRGKANPGMLGAYSDDLLPGLKKLAKAAHKGNSKVVLQIAHGGSQRRIENEEKTDTEAPTAIVEHATNSLPHPMSRDDIKNTIESFAASARRAKEAGFDGVEMHAAHGYLLSQFLSPFFNQRSDAYGGPIKKRARIIFEVYEAIRAEVGSDFPVMIKINSSDCIDGGLSSEDSQWVCMRLSKMGIDAIELSGGIPAAGKLMPARVNINSAKKEAYFKDYAKELRTKIKCPLILVGGMRSLDVMEDIFNEGYVDMFSLARPLISEPELINRWRGGDRKRARCISCNKCLNAARHESRLYCVNFEKNKKS